MLICLALLYESFSKKSHSPEALQLFFLVLNTLSAIVICVRVGKQPKDVLSILRVCRAPITLLSEIPSAHFTYKLFTKNHKKTI